MKTKYLAFIFFLGFLSGCTDNFEDFNTDTKNPAAVEGEYLFSQAQKELMDQVSNTNVNLNVWKLFVQYWTETTYLDESNYDIVNRTIADNVFDVYYRQVLKPLDEAKMLITEKELSLAETEQQRTNMLMIIDLMEVYCYHNLVNIYGDVPYTEAIDVENISPVYDDAATIYSDLISRIDNAVSNLNPGEESFGSADLFYGGDVAAWVKYANSLKLKIGINLADVNATLARSTVEAAVNAGVFESAAENALFAYMGSSPNTNKLHEDLVLSGRKDFVAANTLVDIMVGLEDPRLDDFFTYQVDTSDNDIDDPIWIGGQYGYSSAYANYSHINSRIEEATFPGIMMTYSEVQFYIAEAAARGWSVGQTAEEAYNEAVTASILFWDGTEAEATAYLAKPEVAYNQDNWEELIGVQSYLAFYVRGLDAYTQFRRLDYPAMNEAEAPETGGPVPTRFTYPINEQTLNKVNYEAAAEAIGGDDLLTRLFWDVK